MTRLWLALGLVYAGFLFWYGGCGSPLSADEVERLSTRIDAVAASVEGAQRLKEFARTDDGREFFMVNLNRYRDVPHYADGRPTDGMTSEDVESHYTSKMLPRLLVRACHPWVATVPIMALAGTPEMMQLDRINVVRYRSRRDFLDIVLGGNWAEDAQHKWAALAEAHSFATRPVVALAGPRFMVGALLLFVGVSIRALQRWRARS